MNRKRLYSEYWRELGWPILIFYLKKFGIAAAVFLLFKVIAGSHMLIDSARIWISNPQIGNGLLHAWWFFAWAIALNVIINLRAVIKRYPRDSDAEMDLVHGVWGSINAGFFEEIIWRWFVFLSAMVGVLITNFLFLGFMGVDIVKWAFMHITIPLTDWTSLGAIHEQLYSPLGWTVGASVVIANMDFRDMHENIGVFNWRRGGFTFKLQLGYVNAWFAGLVLFWIMFNYGIQTAIIAHILYDICVNVTAVMMAMLQPKARSFGGWQY